MVRAESGSVKPANASLAGVAAAALAFSLFGVFVFPAAIGNVVIAVAALAVLAAYVVTRRRLD